jgi:hypothetical protein
MEDQKDGNKEKFEFPGLVVAYLHGEKRAERPKNRQCEERTLAYPPRVPFCPEFIICKGQSGNQVQTEVKTCQNREGIDRDQLPGDLSRVKRHLQNISGGCGSGGAKRHSTRIAGSISRAKPVNSARCISRQTYSPWPLRSRAS